MEKLKELECEKCKNADYKLSYIICHVCRKVFCEECMMNSYDGYACIVCYDCNKMTISCSFCAFDACPLHIIKGCDNKNDIIHCADCHNKGICKEDLQYCKKCECYQKLNSCEVCKNITCKFINNPCYFCDDKNILCYDCIIKLKIDFCSKCNEYICEKHYKDSVCSTCRR